MPWCPSSIWFLCLFSFCLLLNSSRGRLVCVRWATDRWHLTPRAAPPLNDWRVTVMCSGLFSHSPTYLFISVVVIVAVTRMLCYMSIWSDSSTCSRQFSKSHTSSSFSCLAFNLFTFFLSQTPCRHFTNISQRFDNHFTSVSCLWFGWTHAIPALVKIVTPFLFCDTNYHQASNPFKSRACLKLTSTLIWWR